MFRKAIGIRGRDRKEPCPMLEIDIPGRDTFGIRHVVCDYNGTIAVDGHLIEGVASRIREITEFAQVGVLTADTFGTVRTECDDLPVDVRVFARDDASACKATIVREPWRRGLRVHRQWFQRYCHVRRSRAFDCDCGERRCVRKAFDVRRCRDDECARRV